MTATDETIERIRRATTEAAGSGMKIVFRSTEIAHLLTAYDQAVAAAAKGASPKRTRGERAPEATSTAEPVAALLPAINEIVRDHCELWGRELPEALTAWAEQHDGADLVDPLLPAVIAALGD